MLFKNAELHNVNCLIPNEKYGGYFMSKIPSELRENSIERIRDISSTSTSGDEIRFNMLSETIKIKLALLNDASPAALIQVFCGSIPHPEYKITVSGEFSEITIDKPSSIEMMKKVSKECGYPFSPELIRVVFYSHQHLLIDIEGDIEPPRADQVPQKTLLFYGSSITHGASAGLAQNTYVFRTAAALGVDYLNRGFAGSATIEENMVDFITSRNDFDIAILEMGINVLNITAEDFYSRVKNMLTKMNERHGDKYIFCIDMFYYSWDIDNNPKAMEFREIVKRCTSEVNNPKFIYICGKDLLHSAKGLTGDFVHPNNFGHEEIAKNLSAIIRKYI